MFDTLVPSASDLTRNVGFVWGDNKMFGSAVGVELGQYSAGYRATPAHDTEWFYAHHPDWIVYLNDRRTVAYEYGNRRATPLDIGNPEVIAWKQGDIDSANHGEAWVDLDNIDSENGAGFAGHYAAAIAPCPLPDRPACGGEWKQSFTGKPRDPSWIRVNLAYVRAMRAYCHTRGRSVMINDASNSNPAYLSPADQIALARAGDGALSEGFPIDGCATDSGWIEGKPHDRQFDAEYQEFTNESARPFFAVGYLCDRDLAHVSPDQAAWVTAAFLMGMRRPDMDFLALVGAGKGMTDYESIEPYGASLKPRIGPMTDDPPPVGSRPYVRRFAHGLVALNPSGVAVATVVVPAGRDQFGEPVGAGPKILQPLTGLVVVTP